jgi:hypothetical protein
MLCRRNTDKPKDVLRCRTAAWSKEETGSFKSKILVQPLRQLILIMMTSLRVANASKRGYDSTRKEAQGVEIQNDRRNSRFDLIHRRFVDCRGFTRPETGKGPQDGDADPSRSI